MNNTNAERARKSPFVDTMGSALGATFHTLWRHLVWTDHVWYHYQMLYGHSQERWDVIHAESAAFFRIANWAMWDGLLLCISRLTGPEETGRGRSAQRNITLRLLPALVDEALRPKVADAVNQATKAAEFCKPARDKVIAHMGERQFLDTEAEPITLGSRKQVGAAIEKIKDALDVVHAHYAGESASYILTLPDGPEDVVDLIARGIASRGAQA